MANSNDYLSLFSSRYIMALTCRTLQLIFILTCRTVKFEKSSLWPMPFLQHAFLLRNVCRIFLLVYI